MSSPKLDKLLGEIRVDPHDHKGYGGLNPHNKNFEHIGKHFHQLLVDHARLTPKKKILDLGCGTGRLACRIQNWMQPGNYVGFDINEYFIEYCEQHYEGQFDYMDVRHDEYNPTGKIEPVDVRLPYEDATFDLVCCIALFNHLKIDWATHYITEIARILKPRGIMFATAVLISPLSLEAVKSRDKHPFKFDVREEEQWFDFTERHTFNVALSENVLRRTLVGSRMMIKEPIRYGEWCGSKAAITGHDVILAARDQWV